jgi:hypothetical protein
MERCDLNGGSEGFPWADIALKGYPAAALRSVFLPRPEQSASSQSHHDRNQH